MTVLGDRNRIIADDPFSGSHFPYRPDFVFPRLTQWYEANEEARAKEGYDRIRASDEIYRLPTWEGLTEKERESVRSVLPTDGSHIIWNTDHGREVIGSLLKYRPT